MKVLSHLQHSNNSLNARLSYNDTKIKVQFTGNCLKKPKSTFTHKKVVNIYIVYELGASSSHSSDPTIKNCLFGAVTLTKNADIEKYKYSGYGIGFDRRSSFSFPSGGFGQFLELIRVLLFILIIKRHISSWKRTNASIRKHSNCRKNVFY